MESVKDISYTFFDFIVSNDLSMKILLEKPTKKEKPNVEYLSIEDGTFGPFKNATVFTSKDPKSYDLTFLQGVEILDDLKKYLNVAAELMNLKTGDGVIIDFSVSSLDEDILENEWVGKTVQMIMEKVRGVKLPSGVMREFKKKYEQTTEKA